MKTAMHIAVFMLTVVAIATLTAGCGGGGGVTGGSGTGLEPPPDPGNVDIAGIVTSATSGQAKIAGATLVLDGERSTTTDSNGRFQFSDVEPGEHLLSVTGGITGYQPYQSKVTVQNGSSEEIPIRLLPETVSLGQITITPPTPNGPEGSYLTGQAYQFTATVTDSAGNVLSGFGVSWAVQPAIGQIDSTGLFTPTAACTAEIIAKVSDGSTQYSDTARIVVSSPVRVRQVACLLRKDRVDIADLDNGEIVKTIKTLGRHGKSVTTWQGKVFVADMGSASQNNITRYDIVSAAPGLDGYCQPEAAYTITKPNGHVYTVSAMTALPDGSLFLGLSYGSTTSNMAILNTSTRQHRLVNTGGEDVDGYSDVVYNPADAKVYVTEKDGLLSRSGILRVDVRATNLVAEQFVDGALAAYSNLATRLSGIAIASDGRIIVSSSMMRRILVLGIDGAMHGDLPVAGIAYPSVTRVGPDGNLYVINVGYGGTLGGRVWRFRLPGGQAIGELRPGDKEDVYDIAFAEVVI